MKSYAKLLSPFIYLLPVALISGPFFSDLFISIITLAILPIIIKNYRVYILSNVSKLFFIFFILLCVSAIFSDFLNETYKSSFFYFRFFIYSLAIVFILENNQDFIKVITYIILATLFVLTTDALLQFIFQKNYLTGEKLLDYKRITGLFGDEKILGSYVIRILPLTIYLMLKNNFKNTTIFFLSLYFSTCIFVSGERTSVLLFTIFLFILFFTFKIEIKHKLVFVVSIFLIFVLTLIYSQNLFDRLFFETFSDMIEVDDKGNFNLYFFSKGHTLMYLTSLNIFFENPMFGTGPKSFRFLCMDELYNISQSYLACSTHPHNYYFQLLAETGILGFSFIVFCLIFLVYSFIKHYKNSKNTPPYLILLVGLIINLFPFAPTGNFFNNWMSIIIYFPVGFLIYELKLLKKND